MSRMKKTPMLGFRGAGRYVAESFRDCFALECEAVKRVRNDMGLTNVEIMNPVRANGRPGESGHRRAGAPGA
ncbi:phosphoenolpyruvate synthase [Salmonella enterica subsp. enterica]|uniref:Phosphoenolpyruvate synthase n=1 Tax=Salmonella enterica I TaxID=59201 RepID=A0A3S4I0X4_SALET|nr:phosphoenolpyruvate synthase [Salmonella enterica subsp. enterica]